MSAMGGKRTLPDAGPPKRPYRRFGGSIPTTGRFPNRCFGCGGLSPREMGDLQWWLELTSVSFAACLMRQRIGTLDQSKQEQLIQQLKSDPQAKTVFEKMKIFAQ